MIALALKFCFFYTLIELFSVNNGESTGLSFSPEGTEFVKQINDSFYISCYNKSALNVWWYRGKEKLSSNFTRVYVERKNETSTSEAGLFFSSIQSNDSGEYVCNGTVNNQTVSARFNLRTYRPITFKDTPTVQRFKEHELGVVKCEAEGEPEPLLSWFVDGQHVEVLKGYTHLGDGLLIQNVTMEDEKREFICRAAAVSNITSNIALIKIRVEVLHRPTLLGAEEIEVYGYLGGTFNLTCEVSANPQATFTWFRNSTLFSGDDNTTITTDKNKSNLFNNYINNTWYEKFQCRAGNELGNATVSYNVHKISKPEPPKKAKIQKTTHNTLILDIHTPPAKAKEIVGYNVQVMKKVDHDKGKQWETARQVFLLKDEPYVIKNLEPNTEYMLRITTQNKAGLGEYTSEMKTKTLYKAASSKLIVSKKLFILLPIFYIFNLKDEFH